MSAFRVVSTIHPPEDCSICAGCVTSAETMAMVTGSVGSTYGWGDEHSATVERIPTTTEEDR